MLALGAVYLATRGKGEPTAMAASANSDTTSPSAATGSSVTLTAAEARRSGVTYATVAVGTLAKEDKAAAGGDNDGGACRLSRILSLERAVGRTW